MKILFDANLSPALVTGLGFPPKVIWLVGNSGTASIAALLHGERPRVEHFDSSTDASLLILSIGTSAV